MSSMSCAPTLVPSCEMPTEPLPKSLAPELSVHDTAIVARRAFSSVLGSTVKVNAPDASTWLTFTQAAAAPDLASVASTAKV